MDKKLIRHSIYGLGIAEGEMQILLLGIQGAIARLQHSPTIASHGFSYKTKRRIYVLLARKSSLDGRTGDSI